MQTGPRRAILFDLDGTLADTSGDLIAAANACLASMGAAASLDPARDRAAAFGGGRALLRLGLGRAGLAAAAARAAAEDGYPAFLEAYAAEADRRTRVFDGVVSALDRLVAAGAALAVCTNKPEPLAIAVLDRLDLAARFAAVEGARPDRPRKPDPAMLHAALAGVGADPAGAVLVGDTVTDRDAARAAGLAVILVSFGGAGPEAAGLGADAVIDHFDGLDAALARVAPGEERTGP